MKNKRLAGLLESRSVHWVALLALCAPYLQGAYDKLAGFSAAVAEMQHFGLEPALPLAVTVIVVELGAPLMILSGRFRWLGALTLAAFTLVATFVANQYWRAPTAEHFAQKNAFYEHLGLAGGFVLVAVHDLRARLGRISS